jgi:ubiquinone/menaquinone biosynthesis C-methylase UbiE
MYRVDYDKISEIYDTVRVGDPEVVSYIVQNKKLGGESRVLEIGCGSGNNTMLMAAATEAEVHGLDKSKGMLAKAAEKSSRIRFIQGDAVTLEGIADESFDVVFMVDVIHHIKDITLMFSNILRVLRKEGMVFVFTDSHDKIINERLTSKYFPETIQVELDRYQSDEEILEAMNSCGFKNVMIDLLQWSEQTDMGDYLIRIAESKGYSMFHLISDEAIERGIRKIREDMEKGPIDYKSSTSVFVGEK